MFDYGAYLLRMGCEVEPSGVWARVGQAAGGFGWKLHISSIQVQAPRLLEVVVPILSRRGVPFKVSANDEILGQLNEGMFGFTQIGKFLTAYPGSGEQVCELARELVEVTGGFDGPSIATDRQLGKVVYSRYGPFNAEAKRDRLGNFLDAAQGAYRVPFELVEGIEDPFESEFGSFVPPNEPHLPGFLHVRTISRSAKAIVMVGLDVRSRDGLDLVLIKHGRRYCMSDERGRDTWDRLEHQMNLACSLSDIVSTPGFVNMEDEADHRFLVLQYVEGRDFSQNGFRRYSDRPNLQKRRLIKDFAALLRTLGDLHGAGIVHRDLSPGNVRVDDNGRAWLLDLEMAAPVGAAANSLFQRGTPGFISPQQAADLAPDFSDDIYSAGCLLVHGITGIDPRRMDLVSSDLNLRLEALSGAPLRLIELACKMIESSAEMRPSLKIALECLERVQAELQCSDLEAQRASGRLSVAPRAILDEGLNWLIQGGFRDSNWGLPLSPELSSIHNESVLSSPQAYKLYRSANRGVAGNVYAISRLASLGVEAGKAGPYVGKAVDWLLARFPTDDDQLPGLHFGESGVSVAIIEAVKTGLLEEGPWIEPYLAEVFSGELDWPDYTHGAAGQGIAALRVASLTGSKTIGEYADRCARYLENCQESDGSWAWPEGVPGMSGTRYTGFAHGTAGVCYFLSAHAMSRGRELPNSVRAGLGWLSRQQLRDTDGNVHWHREASDPQVWHWWCHGGPGIALAFMAAYAASKEPAFATSAKAALAVCMRPVPFNNLTFCHGVSGIGEILLEASTVFSDDQFLERARELGNCLAAMARRDENGVYWLAENPFHATADLMVGSGGPLCFLARLAATVSPDPGAPLLLNFNELSVDPAESPGSEDAGARYVIYN